MTCSDAGLRCVNGLAAPSPLRADLAASMVSSPWFGRYE